jgi:hypothetical protein
MSKLKALLKPVCSRFCGVRPSHEVGLPSTARFQLGYDPKKAKSFIFANIKNLSFFDTRRPPVTSASL